MNLKSYFDNRILELIEAGFNIPFRPVKPNGHRQQYFTARKLFDSDINKMLELQENVYKSLKKKSLFVFTDRDDCKDSIDNDVCLGVFCDGEMVAASILVLNRKSERNVGKMFGYKSSECATLDSTFVLPEFRGHGIQRFLIKLRLALAAKAGASMAFATVSPDNTFSLDNLKAEGFSVYQKMLLYGGLERFVVLKRID